VKSDWQRVLSHHKNGKTGIRTAMWKWLQLAYGALKSSIPFDAKIALAS